MKAVLIGGWFNLTQLEVNRDEPFIYMYLPKEPKYAASYGAPDAVVECKQIRYELITKTPQNVLIYEFYMVDL